MKKIIFILLFSTFSLFIKAQIAVAYYPFNNVFSISSNTQNVIWGDLRLETNTFFGNVTIEPHLMWNYKRTDWVNYYAGLGVSISPFQTDQDIDLLNGYSIDFGVRVKPIEKHRNFQVLFELSPFINKDFDGGLFRALLGVGYNFGKKD
ncbi:MAG: hypothetical protein N4A46_14440 [Schleiferiaceae bacterium]|jgi:hypothetical protein|nr:hypothetical protein [Schleiferiaceae bacterium]